MSHSDICSCFVSYLHFYSFLDLSLHPPTCFKKVTRFRGKAVYSILFLSFFFLYHFFHNQFSNSQCNRSETCLVLSSWHGTLPWSYCLLRSILWLNLHFFFIFLDTHSLRGLTAFKHTQTSWQLWLTLKKGTLLMSGIFCVWNIH